MPEGGSQLVKNTVLNRRGQTTNAQPSILHTKQMGVGNDTTGRTKVKRAAHPVGLSGFDQFPGGTIRWITL